MRLIYILFLILFVTILLYYKTTDEKIENFQGEQKCNGPCKEYCRGPCKVRVD